jgi:hypothetical protein
VVVVGPAGAGKTTTLERAVEDLHRWSRVAFGVAPTAKAARVLETEAAMPADTVAKLLHEWSRPDRPPGPRWQLPPGATLVVDEAGMLGTGALDRLVTLAHTRAWRLVLVGDPEQLHAVGRGGLFAEVCAASRVHELAHIHRFADSWEGPASLGLRAGDARALDAYEAHDRIVAGTLDDHVHEIATRWVRHTSQGQTVAISAATNDHVDVLNDAVQRLRLGLGQLDPNRAVPIADGEVAHPGDVVVTRRNDRDLVTSVGQPVRNRDLWHVVATHPDGALTVSERTGQGTVTLPADYVSQHVRLGYAATEHGVQGDTVDVGITLVSEATTGRGLYVGATRGRHDNQLHVVTESRDIGEARDVLEAALARDRADIPALTQRRRLAQQQPPERVAAPADLIPDWVASYRTRLIDRRAELVEQLAARAERRQAAGAQLGLIRPELAAARAAWQPYAERIDALERQLRSERRPELWKATYDADHAGFGHRHGAQRRVEDAAARIEETEAALVAVHTEGAAIEARFVTLARKTANLENLVHPSAASHSLDDLDRGDVQRIDETLAAVDTWCAWSNGHRVAAAELIDAVAVLSGVDCYRYEITSGLDEIGRERWHHALKPVAQLLRDRGFVITAEAAPELEQDSLGIGI